MGFLGGDLAGVVDCDFEELATFALSTLLSPATIEDVGVRALKLFVDAKRLEGGFVVDVAVASVTGAAAKRLLPNVVLAGADAGTAGASLIPLP